MSRGPMIPRLPGGALMPERTLTRDQRVSEEPVENAASAVGDTCRDPAFPDRRPPVDALIDGIHHSTPRCPSRGRALVDGFENDSKGG
jgi:hypothetical protein